MDVDVLEKILIFYVRIKQLSVCTCNLDISIDGGGGAPALESSFKDLLEHLLNQITYMKDKLGEFPSRAHPGVDSHVT
jgi:hypothetical protein